MNRTREQFLRYTLRNISTAWPHHEEIRDLLDYLLWLLYPKVTFRIWNTRPLERH